MEPNLSKSGHFVVDIIADMTTDLKTHLISYSLVRLLMTNKAQTAAQCMQPQNDEQSVMNHILFVTKLYIERKYC